MSGETEKDVSGWTVDTVHTHLIDLLRAADNRYEQRFVAQEKANLIALEEASKAVSKAEQATEKRFESVNEFRAALDNQSRNSPTRTEMDTEFRSLREQHLSIEKRINNLEGDMKAMTGHSRGIQASAGAVVAVVTVAVAILSAVILIINVVTSS